MSKAVIELIVARQAEDFVILVSHGQGGCKVSAGPFKTKKAAYRRMGQISTHLRRMQAEGNALLSDAMLNVARAAGNANAFIGNKRGDFP